MVMEPALAMERRSDVLKLGTFYLATSYKLTVGNEFHYKHTEQLLSAQDEQTINAHDVLVSWVIELNTSAEENDSLPRFFAHVLNRFVFLERGRVCTSTVLKVDCVNEHGRRVTVLADTPHTYFQASL
jgi:hypothetical protein